MNHLDLYIEKIISPMNLDREQRDEMVRELRCHLDESVETLTLHGMGKTEAERMAMEKFGDPKTIAGRFGGWQGNFWRWFEALMLALVSSCSIWIAMRFNQFDLFETSAGWVCLGAYALIFLIQYLWNRVQINGTLKIYRFLRPTQSIPFSQITSVRLQRFRLFGIRRFFVHYGDKVGTFSTGMPNAHCAALALKVLCPQALDEKAAPVLEQQLEVKSEGLVKRILLSLAGLGAGALLLREIFRYPDGEGASLGFPLAVIIIFIITTVQYYTTVNRAKRGLFAFLAALLSILVYPIFLAAALSFGGFRYLEFFLLAITLLVLGLVWWSGRKRTVGLITSSAFLVTAGALCYWLFMRPNPAWNFSVRVEGIAASAQWLDGNPLKLATQSLDHSENRLSIHILHQDGSFNLERQQALEPGTWGYLRPTGTSARRYFLRDYDKEEDSEQESKLRFTDVYYLDENDEMVKAATLENTYGTFSILAGGGAITAPDASAIFLQSAKKGVGVYSLNGGKSELLDGYSFNHFRRWSGNHSAEFLVKLDSDTTDTRSLVTMDMQNMSTTSQQKLNLQDSYSASYVQSRDAVIFHVPSAENSFTDTTRDKSDRLWVNPEKGTSYTLTGSAGSDLMFDLNYDLNLLAYVAKDNDKRSLVLAGSDGKLDEISIGSGIELAWLSLSPDGKKVAYLDRRTEKWFWNLGRLRLWDREKKKLETIALETGVATILDFLRHDSVASWRPVQWLPDGSGLLWAHMTPRYSPKGMDTQFYRYKFEK